MNRIHFAEAFVREALHQIKFICDFFRFRFKTCKDSSYVNKIKLFITKIQKILFFFVANFNKSSQGRKMFIAERILFRFNCVYI